ncbi:hypothetical protein FSP39_017327 [Pinctada imbricata]|uniref:Hexosyltransferase n=1 Tax=Pinctada imbricata TaxID=66713 RepID=A0AA88XD97_PINIB|nr:hypothetical protein FSP39_017327 [Pinctada imbricata]
MKRKHEYRRGDVSTRQLTSYGLSSSFKRLSLAFPTTQNKTTAHSKTTKKTELKFTSKYWCDHLENEYPLVLNFTKLLIQGDREFKNIKPVHEHPFHYIFNASIACAAGDKIKVLCVVKSANNNFEMREIIRKTWAKDAKEDGSKVLFALGYSNNQSFQEKIREENRIYMDIIQENFLDSYSNNTLKTVMQIRWISKFCSNAIYVFMVDDDVIVNYRNLIRYFDNVNPADRNVLYFWKS